MNQYTIKRFLQKFKSCIDNGEREFWWMCSHFSGKSENEMLMQLRKQVQRERIAHLKNKTSLTQKKQNDGLRQGSTNDNDVKLHYDSNQSNIEKTTDALQSQSQSKPQIQTNIDVYDLPIQSLFPSESKFLQFKQGVIDRIEKKKPLQYVLGDVTFCNLTLKTQYPTLVPRPETEQIVAWLVNYMNLLKEFSFQQRTCIDNSTTNTNERFNRERYSEAFLHVQQQDPDFCQEIDATTMLLSSNKRMNLDVETTPLDTLYDMFELYKSPITSKNDEEKHSERDDEKKGCGESPLRSTFNKESFRKYPIHKYQMEWLDSVYSYEDLGQHADSRLKSLPTATTTSTSITTPNVPHILTPHVLDICSGSGNIPIAISAHIPKSIVLGIDLSTDAINLARLNAKETKSTALFYQVDLFTNKRADTDNPNNSSSFSDDQNDRTPSKQLGVHDFLHKISEIPEISRNTRNIKTMTTIPPLPTPLPPTSQTQQPQSLVIPALFDMIISNPPYIAYDEYTKLEPEVRLWEDIRALVPFTPSLYDREIRDSDLANLQHVPSNYNITHGKNQWPKYEIIQKYALQFYERIILLSPHMINFSTTCTETEIEESNNSKLVLYPRLVFEIGDGIQSFYICDMLSIVGYQPHIYLDAYDRPRWVVGFTKERIEYQ